MNCRTLINIVDDFNDEIILLSQLLKPKTIVTIRGRGKEYQEYISDVINYLSEKMQDTTIIDRTYPIKHPQTIKDIISEYSGKGTVINVSGGSTLDSILAYQAAVDLNIKIIYCNMDLQQFYEVNNKETIPLNDLFNEEVAFTVEDFIKFTGGGIVTDTTNTYGFEEYEKLNIFLVNNYLSIWKSIRKILRSPYISKYHCANKQGILRIDKRKLKETHSSQILKFFNEIKKIHFITSIIDKMNEIEIIFNESQSGYYLISGSWFEHMVYRIIKEIKDIDDIHSGVRFLWDQDSPYIENEIDVLATADCRLICVSCKDTREYDTSALNELDIYAERLGGEDAIKILAVTEYPYKNTIFERAEEMGINIVVFDGDEGQFKNKINQVINL